MLVMRIIVMPAARRRVFCTVAVSALLLCLSGLACSAEIPPEAQGCPNFKSPLADVTFVAFDTETTGYAGGDHRIVELGAVKFRNGEIIEEKTWLINPERYIPYFARQVHHISNDMVKNSPTFAQVYPEFMEFIDGAVLVAHNAPFDVGFIRDEVIRNSLSVPTNPVINSLNLFRSWFPEAGSHSLEPLTEHLDLPKGTYHRATDDSRYLAEIIHHKVQNRKGRQMTFGDVYKAAHGVVRF